MSKPSILIQLDVDTHASVFDRVVAVDAGVERLFSYHAVEPRHVRDLVHGAIFTRGPKVLHNTAIFVGGSDVRAAESILAEVVKAFFGPMRVSVLFDANGANTTAAAAVLMASRHTPLSTCTAAVLGATGPVGQRAVRLLARAGANVRVASRKLERAELVCQEVRTRYEHAHLTPFATSTPTETTAALEGSDVVVAAAAAGVELVSEEIWKGISAPKVAIDLNAVPPTGISAIEPLDAGVERRPDVACYGAIGVGGLKMKIHKAAIQALFETNDQVLDAEEVYEIGLQCLS